MARAQSVNIVSRVSLLLFPALHTIIKEEKMTLIAKILISVTLVLLFGTIVYLKAKIHQLNHQLDYFSEQGFEKLIFDYYSQKRNGGDSDESD